MVSHALQLPFDSLRKAQIVGILNYVELSPQLRKSLVHGCGLSLVFLVKDANPRVVKVLDCR